MIKRTSVVVLTFLILAAYSPTLFAADSSNSEKTPEQKLQVWLKAPAKQKWHSKKLIGQRWWRLLESLPLEKAEQMWPAAVDTKDASRIASVTYLLALKKDSYTSAKAYFNDKLKTPKSGDESMAKLFKRARGHKYELTRILMHFAKDMSQNDINKEALDITGGKIQRAKWGVKLLKYVTGEAKGVLLLNAIHKYGDSPRQMKRNGGLLKQLQTALNEKTVSKNQALKVITRAKASTDKKLAKAKKDSKRYKDYKELSSKLDSFYNKLNG